ncbi:MAG: MCE family protein [Mycobacterium sp.]
MNLSRSARRLLVFGLAVVLVGAVALVVLPSRFGKTMMTAYFENSNGIYEGDTIRVLGVPVGKIKKIVPQPSRSQVTFWVDSKYKIPADAKAVVISPTLVSARFIQLIPVYTGGPALGDNAVIPRDRTAVPVEYDDLRIQLKKLTETLQPTTPGGVSTLGGFVNTLADNLRGQGSSVRDTVIKLSQSLSILGDQSGDIFGTVKNLSILVSALSGSTDLMRQLNQNLAGVTGLLANSPDEVGTAVADLNTAVTDMDVFLQENQGHLGTAFDRLAEITQALGESKDDLKQSLHVAPTGLSNFINIYEPAGATTTGALSLNNFANPLQFVCSSIQAASRLNAEQSAKLCVQYLAPIFKNRQYNFLPLGVDGMPGAPILTVGAQARPNEVTYSEDWMRPDYVPPAPASAPVGGDAPASSSDPAAGLQDLLLPAEGGR